MKQLLLLTKPVILMMFMFTWTVQAQDRPSVDEQFYLDSKYSMPLPASILEVVVDSSGNESGRVLTYEEQYFAPGTKFAFTGIFAVGNYGDSNNNSNMPLVFVNPIDANGDVDLSLTVGFPAPFLSNVATKKKASEYTYLQQVFSDDYSKIGTTYDAETKDLEGYLSFVSRLQQTDIYAGQKFDAATAGSAPATKVTPISKTPKLSFPSDITSAPPKPRPRPQDAGKGSAPPEDSAADVATDIPSDGNASGEAVGVDVAQEVAPAEKVSAPEAGLPEVDEPIYESTDSDDIYHNDARLRNAVVVKASESLPSVILEVKNEDGSVRHLRRELEIEKGTRFVPILWKSDPKRDKATQEMVRWFYKVDADGNISKDESGEREIYVLPVSKLRYKDPVDGTVRQVSATSKLYSGASAEAAPAPKSSTDAGADVAGAKPADVVKPPAKASFTPPARPISLTPAAKTTPAVEAPKPQANTIPADALALTECRNEAFADQLSKAGEDCSLVEIKDFQLVKSQLIQQLKGQSPASSVLLNSSVVAIDNSTKMCSKLDITHEAYLDDSRAQAKINEYKQNMTDAYKNIVSSIHTNKSGRIGAAFLSAPKESAHTYSCDKTQSSCRYSFDFYTPEKLPLVKEITMFADDLSQQEKIRVYGPSEENKYLVVFKRGGKDVRTLVLQDDPGVVFNGPVGKLLKDMKAFEGNYKYSRLSDIQNEYSSDRLKDSSMGHFISSETIYSNGQKEVLKERLGDPASLSMISKIRQNKTFYELRCRFNALERKTSLPKWDASAEGVN